MGETADNSSLLCSPAVRVLADISVELLRITAPYHDGEAEPATATPSNTTEH
jgi:hypothetical protein